MPRQTDVVRCITKHGIRINKVPRIFRELARGVSRVISFLTLRMRHDHLLSSSTPTLMTSLENIGSPSTGLAMAQLSYLTPLECHPLITVCQIHSFTHPLVFSHFHLICVVITLSISFTIAHVTFHSRRL